MKIVSVGEILWDLVEGCEFLGGAPLNFALHAARLGHQRSWSALWVTMIAVRDHWLRYRRVLCALTLFPESPASPQEQ